MVYDGINDAPASNAPPWLLRENYDPYAWYQTVNLLASYHGSASFALPYTLRYLLLALRQAVLRDRYVPIYAPRRAWRRYGRDHRSVASFTHNLEAILDLAAQRGDPVLPMTFATPAPPNHGPDAIRARKVGKVYIMPLEERGRPADVLAAVARENDTIRSLAARRQGVLCVDQAKLMPGSPRYVDDVCHLTVVGSIKFVENLLTGRPPGSGLGEPVTVRRCMRAPARVIVERSRPLAGTPGATEDAHA